MTTYVVKARLKFPSIYFNDIPEYNAKYHNHGISNTFPTPKSSITIIPRTKIHSELIHTLIISATTHRTLSNNPPSFLQSMLFLCIPIQSPLNRDMNMKTIITTPLLKDIRSELLTATFSAFCVYHCRGTGTCHGSGFASSWCGWRGFLLCRGMTTGTRSRTRGHSSPQTRSATRILSTSPRRSWSPQTKLRNLFLKVILLGRTRWFQAPSHSRRVLPRGGNSNRSRFNDSTISRWKHSLSRFIANNLPNKPPRVDLLNHTHRLPRNNTHLRITFRVKGILPFHEFPFPCSVCVRSRG